jgi:hypothetical protein
MLWKGIIGGIYAGVEVITKKWRDEELASVSKKHEKCTNSPLPSIAPPARFPEESHTLAVLVSFSNSRMMFLVDLASLQLLRSRKIAL